MSATLPTARYAGLGCDEVISRALKSAHHVGVEFADIRFASVRETEISGGRKESKRALAAHKAGGNIRVLSGHGQGVVNLLGGMNLDIEGSVTRALSLAKAANDKGRGAVTLASVQPTIGSFNSSVKTKPEDVDISEKMRIVKETSAYVSSLGSGNLRGWTRYNDVSGQIAVGSTDGTRVSMDIVQTYVSISAVAKQGSEISSSQEFVGGTGGFEVLMMEDLHKAAETVGQRALAALNGSRVKSGPISAVLSPTATGTLAHEVIGHNCEGDLVNEGESVFSDKLGEQIISDALTVIDDPLVSGFWGSADFDLEGTRTRKRLLVHKGILSEFLHSRETAGALGQRANGCTRTEDIMYFPLPRMSNTLIAAGTYGNDEIIEDTRSGVLAKHISGGAADSASGFFQLLVDEGYLIEKGSIETPLRSFRLIGDTLSTLNNIDSVGRDISVANGFCFKRGQTVPVTYGGPVVRIQRILAAG